MFMIPDIFMILIAHKLPILQAGALGPEGQEVMLQFWKGRWHIFHMAL